MFVSCTRLRDTRGRLHSRLFSPPDGAGDVLRRDGHDRDVRLVQRRAHEPRRHALHGHRSQDLLPQRSVSRSRGQIYLLP